LGDYTVTVNATSNGTVNTQDTFLELSGVLLGLKRIRVRLGDGTATAGLDNDWRVDIVRKTAGGATGTSGTAINTRKMGRTSGATVTVKNGTSAFSTATLQETIDTSIVNGRAIYEYVARDESEMITNHTTLGSGGMLAILIQSSVVSQKFQVSCYWTEF
jgi:hypothetical protein